MAGLSKVLIVEDDHDIGAIYSFVLRQAGYEVAVAHNGKEALDAVLSFCPQVVLLDIMMPDMDGLKVLEAVRTDKQYADMRPTILIMSNLDQPNMVARAKELGADGYVVKVNIVPHDLLPIVEEALARVKTYSQTNKSPKWLIS